jgi:HK97 family phage major capsid protein
MSRLDNSTLLAKADLALADLTAGGGILQPAQAQKFMRLLIKQSVLLQQCTVVPMAAPKQQFSKLKFGSRILRPGQEATAVPAAQRVKPDLSQVELDAKLFKGEVRLSDEVLEDSIERGELRQTLMEMMADAISRDMEEILVNGDTASADPFLATLDGVLKQATSNVVDAAGAPISKDVLGDLLKSLPSEHLRDKSSMGFLLPASTRTWTTAARWRRGPRLSATSSSRATRRSSTRASRCAPSLSGRRTSARRMTARPSCSPIPRTSTSASGDRFASSPRATSPRAR